MTAGLSFEQHNEIIFQILGILEDGTLSPDERIQQATSYCYGGGVFWPQEALEAWMRYEQTNTHQIRLVDPPQAQGEAL
jgi:hypothetical protein